jgi:long-subunit fatty acid transport protein
LNYLNVYRFDKEMRFPVALKDGASMVDFTYNFDQNGSFSAIAPAFGIEVTPRLSLGVTLNLWHHRLTNSSRYRLEQTSQGTFSASGLSGGFNQVQSDEFEVDEGYSLVVGGMYRYSRSWTFAGVVKPAYTLDIDHGNILAIDVQGDLEQFLVDETISTKRDAELRFPWIVGGGVAWRPNDEWTVSSDVTWTQWSEYLFHEGGASTNPVTGKDDELDDTITWRLGCEYLWILDDYVFPFRCGLGYDPAPAVGEADDFYTLNAGMGVQIYNRISIDLAYEFRWGNNVNKSNLTGIDGGQDVKTHRLLASLIYHF